MSDELRVLVVAPYTEEIKLSAVEMWAEHINATVAPDLEKAEYFFKHHHYHAVVVRTCVEKDALEKFLEIIRQRGFADTRQKVAVFLARCAGDLNVCSDLYLSDLIVGFFPDSYETEKLCNAIRAGVQLREQQGKRQFPRSKVRLPGIIKVLGEDGIIEGEVRNLSSGGLSMRITRSTAVRLEKLANIRFGVSLGKEKKQVIGDGHLTWFDESLKSEDSGMVQLGVRFTALDPSVRSELAQYLNIAR